jgi:UDP-GlcNAc:undecaprenyl-phosphate/decaprenyl-phosphate GlcNAc-1-phosphate transferase
MLINNFFLYLLALGIIFTFSLLINLFVIKQTHKYRLYSAPNPIVKNHNKIVPLGGGLAVFFPLLTASFFINVPHWIILLLSAALFIGLIDDILKLKPIYKFSFQIILAFLFFSFVEFNKIYFVVYFLLFLTFQNSINLIDIMDGLAGSVSFFMFLTAAILFSRIYTDEIYFTLALLNLFFSIAVLSFLIFNNHPAKIFMGEAGSLTIGFLYGINIVFAFEYSFYLGILFIINGYISLFETLFLIIVRSIKKIPFYTGTPDHFALRLLNHGKSVPQIIGTVIILSFVIACLVIGLSLTEESLIPLIIILLIFIISSLYFYFYLSKLYPYKIVTESIDTK